MRKEELAQKERLLMADMSEKGEKIKKVVKWSLIAGLLALLGYGLYRAFAGDDAPKKKKKKKGKMQPPQDSPWVDDLIEFSAPSLGKWLLKTFKD